MLWIIISTTLTIKNFKFLQSTYYFAVRQLDMVIKLFTKYRSPKLCFLFVYSIGSKIDFDKHGNRQNNLRGLKLNKIILFLITQV